jgi:predicted tellurium resistance membrane protein TerC
VEPLLGHGLLREVPSAVQVVLFALIGIPVYVCASGATPIAAVAIMQSVSPGAAMAFLLAGPATNVTTFGILSQLHGRKAAIAFGAAVFLGAVGAGLTIDGMGIEGIKVLEGGHHDHVSLYKWVALGAIGVLFVVSLFRQGPRGMTERISTPIHADH